MLTYKNMGGLHTLLDGTTVPKGGVFQSDDPYLCKKFRGKFERVIEEPAPAPAPVVQSVDTPEEKKTAVQKAAETGATDVLPEGTTDVTGEFPSAQEADMRVLKDKRGWYVYDDGGKEPANEKPLKRKAVDCFIEELLADEGE